MQIQIHTELREWVHIQATSIKSWLSNAISNKWVKGFDNLNLKIQIFLFL